MILSFAYCRYRCLLQFYFKVHELAKQAGFPTHYFIPMKCQDLEFVRNVSRSFFVRRHLILSHRIKHESFYLFDILEDGTGCSVRSRCICLGSFVYQASLVSSSFVHNYVFQSFRRLLTFLYSVTWIQQLRKH